MPRFFVPSDGFSDDTVTIRGADAHHISFALRMAAGERITVCDMKGRVHHCTLLRFDGETVTARILSSEDAENESPVYVHLFQAYPKSDKLEWIIQKAVELGACEITPFESERVIKRPKADRIAHVTERNARIAEEAAKQCGRSVLPHVNAPIRFDEMLKEAMKADVCLFCYEGDGTQSIKEICAAHAEAKRISLVVGSEGGFSLTEAESAKAAGMKMTGLGKRILRCETAPLYALSALSFFFEL